MGLGLGLGLEGEMRFCLVNTVLSEKKICGRNSDIYIRRTIVHESHLECKRLEVSIPSSQHCNLLYVRIETTKGGYTRNMMIAGSQFECERSN